MVFTVYSESSISGVGGKGSGQLRLLGPHITRILSSPWWLTNLRFTLLCGVLGGGVRWGEGDGTADLHK